MLCCFVTRFKGSREIFDSDKYEISTDGDKYTLLIKNVFGEDQDEYVVRASNAGGSKTSRADLEIRGNRDKAMHYDAILNVMISCQADV